MRWICPTWMAKCNTTRRRAMRQMTMAQNAIHGHLLMENHLQGRANLITDQRIRRKLSSKATKTCAKRMLRNT